MTALNLDRISYLVISDHSDGSLHHERLWSDMDRKTTIQDILHGQLGDVLRVIEWNAVKNICNDVTAEILSEVDALRGTSAEYRPLTGQSAIEARWDHERDYRKHGEAA